MEAQALDVATLSREQRVELLYRSGRLRFKFQPHQLAFYDAFRSWNVARQSADYLANMEVLGAQYDNMWVNRWSRRVGKTAVDLLLGHEECARFCLAHGRGAIGMIAIPVQKKIGGVLVPLTREVFRDAPRGMFPEHRSSGNGMHEHLYIPALESRIVLVGIDYHPRALAGTYLDFFCGTEFGFADLGVADMYESIIQPQFQRRPWAWSLIESSEPEVPDHDFTTRFVPDAKARNAYWSMVITDNTSLSPSEIAKEIRRSGGRHSPTCKRELFNEVEPDPEQMVVPEFIEAVHVVDPDDWPMPEFATAYEGLDPGTTDPLGIVGFYFDFMRQTVVVQFAWRRPNASTGDVVEVIREFERSSWGTEHALPGKREPGTRLTRIAGVEPLPSGQIWEAPEASLTYWDQGTWTLRPNPYSRISDVHARFILDLNRDYAMNVRAAEKEPGSAEADLQYLRMLFAARNDNGRPKIVILRNGRTEQLIAELRSGRWNSKGDDYHRTDWVRSKLLGHLDTLSALKYAVRDVRWNRNPFPPAVRDPNLPNVFVPPELRKRAAVSLIQPRRMGGGFQPRSKR
jgi:hypothetical protein